MKKAGFLLPLAILLTFLAAANLLASGPVSPGAGGDRQPYGMLDGEDEPDDSPPSEDWPVSPAAEAWLRVVDGMPPLMRAAYYNDLAGVRKALKAGAQVGERYWEGQYTALMWAASNAGPEVVQALLDAGADIGEVDNFGNPAIMWASGGCAATLSLMFMMMPEEEWNLPAIKAFYAGSEGNPRPGAVIRLLIRYGARVDVPYGEGHTALEWARKQENNAAEYAILKVTDALPPSSKGSRVWQKLPPRQIAQIEAAAGRPPLPEELTHWENVFNKPPLARAAEVGAAKMVWRYLLDGEEVNELYNTCSALMFCMFASTLEGFTTSHAETAAALIEAGAEVNAADRLGQTPLMWACSFIKDVEAIRVLLRAGADPNVKDLAGMTALMMIATGNRNVQPIMQLLADYGADFQARDNKGRSVMDLARENRSKRDEAVEAASRLAADSRATPEERLRRGLVRGDNLTLFPLNYFRCNGSSPPVAHAFFRQLPRKKATAPSSAEP